MSSLEPESVGNHLKQVHEYIRHIAQLLVAWFTFFVTVNYAVMGWLLVSLFVTKPSGLQLQGGRILTLIAGLFALQNILGICACLLVRSHLLERASLVKRIEDSLPGHDGDNSLLPSFQTVPAALYSRTAVLMTAALVLLLIAWCILAFVAKRTLGSNLYS